MAIQTKPSSVVPRDFLESLRNPTRRKDASTLFEVYQEVTREKPMMWGPSIIGFGQYHYKYASGHEGDYFKGGFAPRSANMVCYLMRGIDHYAGQLASLGPHRRGKSCLYLGTFKNIDLTKLYTVIQSDWEWMIKKYG